MDEIKCAPGQIESAQSPSFVKKFIEGEFGLAKTYWLFGVVLNFILAIALRVAVPDALAYWIGAAWVCYQLALLVALWHAGKKYQGPRMWPILAFFLVMMAVFRNIGAVLAFGEH